MSEATITVVNVKNQVSPEEWQVRQDLAAAYRLVASRTLLTQPLWFPVQRSHCI